MNLVRVILAALGLALALSACASPAPAATASPAETATASPAKPAMIVHQMVSTGPDTLLLGIEPANIPAGQKVWLVLHDGDNYLKWDDKALPFGNGQAFRGELKLPARFAGKPFPEIGFLIVDPTADRELLAIKLDDDGVGSIPSLPPGATPIGTRMVPPAPRNDADSHPTMTA